MKNKKISLNLFVAYDLKYHKTKKTDYTNIHPELVEQIGSSKFIGSIARKEEIDYLIREKVIDHNNHLLEGVLPIRLKFIKADTEQITTRFYKACIGWIRYKPLLLYITQPDSYEEKIKQMREQLTEALPKISVRFGQPEFMDVLPELEKYHKNVKKHYSEFIETQRIWAKIMEHFAIADSIK